MTKNARKLLKRIVKDRGTLVTYNMFELQKELKIDDIWSVVIELQELEALLEGIGIADPEHNVKAGSILRSCLAESILHKEEQNIKQYRWSLRRNIIIVIGSVFGVFLQIPFTILGFHDTIQKIAILLTGNSQ